MDSTDCDKFLIVIVAVGATLVFVAELVSAESVLVVVSVHVVVVVLVAVLVVDSTDSVSVAESLALLCRLDMIPCQLRHLR